MSDIVTMNGLIYRTTEPLVPPVDSDVFLQSLLNRLGTEKERLSEDTALMSRSFAFREPHVPNPNNPIEAKWALLLPLVKKKPKP